uniref:Uncharacterized protein n=1 Tax=Theropithecus gelada TaxID=9565 RepID=A0A8D2JV84_THEGE
FFTLHGLSKHLLSDICPLMTGIHFEKYVVRQFCCCADVRMYLHNCFCWTSPEETEMVSLHA